MQFRKTQDAKQLIRVLLASFWQHPTILATISPAIVITKTAAAYTVLHRLHLHFLHLFQLGLGWVLSPTSVLNSLGTGCKKPHYYMQTSEKTKYVIFPKFSM